MKKYKHIKTGDIVSKIDNDIIRFYTSNKFGIIHAEIVENSNDWLEITKPEYTILSYKCKNKILYYTITEDNHRWFSSNKNDMYQTNEMEIEVNSHLGFTIHSVKRLSDGEIFTVGDKYNWKSNKNRTNIIRQILLEDNKILIHDSEYISEEYDADLDQIEKVKQPLFTTEDGVDIYKGNTYYYINTGFIGETQEVKNAICPIMKGAYTFSTKQAAEEYIIMNKPCLSYSDLERLIGAKGTLLRIEELVKQKLKQ